MALTIKIPSWKQIKNYVFETPASMNQAFQVNTAEEVKDLSHYITPLQLQRLRHDVKMWREAVAEVEQAYYPQRVRMQRLYIDTVLNGHVKSCMNRRRKLSTLREYQFCNENEVENEEVLKIFKEQPWFITIQEYIIDARAYGYSLIKLGDLIEDAFPKVGVIKRWNTSPERLNVTAYVYSLSGIKFLSEPYCEWHLWVTTPNDNGTSDCGYGYLYEVALYEIILRNLLGFNGDFVELFAQPYRVGKSNKTEGPERDALEASLKNMGSSGYAVIDPQDEIEFLETALGGTGYKSYDNLEARCEKKISKLILGHADALDSVPGKLGSGQGGEESPVSQALSEVQTDDGRYIESYINSQLLPKMRDLGFPIPDGIKFKYKNDDEAEDFRRKEDESNEKTAQIAVAMKNANLQMEEVYFTQRTGIPCKKIEAPTPPPFGGGNPSVLQKERIQNKLEILYSKKKK